MARWTTSTESGGTKDSLRLKGTAISQTQNTISTHTNTPAPLFKDAGSRPMKNTKLSLKQVSALIIDNS